VLLHRSGRSETFHSIARRLRGADPWRGLCRPAGETAVLRGAGGRWDDWVALVGGNTGEGPRQWKTGSPEASAAPADKPVRTVGGIRTETDSISANACAGKRRKRSRSRDTNTTKTAKGSRAGCRAGCREGHSWRDRSPGSHRSFFGGLGPRAWGVTGGTRRLAARSVTVNTRSIRYGDNGARVCGRTTRNVFRRNTATGLHLTTGVSPECHQRSLRTSTT
jgi:hypothetical protein